MWFDFSREEGFPTQYSPNHTPVTVDVLEAGFIAAYIILLIAFFISAPTNDWKLTTSRYFRITVVLTIGLLIMLGNYGQEWEVAHVRTRAPYRAGSPAQINASLGLHVGLRGVNVTLKDPSPPYLLQHEKINYNERFEWTWDQGRFGFGPFAGHLQREFRAAQFKGTPTPILWVVEHFVIDGEGFRHGRFHRIAGWFCHIAMWCAFVSWLLAIILFRSVVAYGGYWLGACGSLQLIANLLWLVIRNPLPLKIVFEDGIMETRFGNSFWITFVNGIVCITIASAIMLADIFCHTELYTFMGVDPLNSYDEVAYLTKTEELNLRKKKSNDMPLMEMSSMEQGKDDEEDNEYVPVLIRRGTMFGPPVVRTNKPRHL